MDRLDLPLFREQVEKPEEAIDLGEAALLIAAPEYPWLDVSRYVHMLGLLGGEVKARGGDAAALLGLLYNELGFRGNREAYDDPRNSFLNEVIDRRRGIPISLAVVAIEVGRRAGLAAEGVSFPGHFLVRVAAAGGARPSLLVDPFTGLLMTDDNLRALFRRATGLPGDPPAELLLGATKRQILFRMLANLRALFTASEEPDRLRTVVSKMLVLAPDDAELATELELLGGSDPAGGWIAN